MPFQLLSFLIVFPLSIAALAFANRKVAFFGPLVYVGGAVLIFASLMLLNIPLGGKIIMIPAHVSWAEPVMLIGELGISAFLLFLALKRKDIPVSLMVVLSAGGLFWFHFGPGHAAHAEANLFLDLFSVIMGLIVGVIGSLIAIYAVGYMKDFCHHHREVPDRRPFFFGLIFLFLSAMFGVCFSNNLFWLFFFWEITTVCSFLLIGYKGDEQSVKNAFWALRWNLLGGVAFLIGIIYLYMTTGTVELNKILTLPKAVVLLPVVLMSFAGMTKAAQLPFSSWLVGAMVAPTPVSALLHSSTMVKAGVYIVLKFAPVLEGTTAGFVIALVGLLTFLLGSFICISQNDAKKVLAYSTIANLGLIILCAGVGTYEAVWAGILLLIFHAISKGLLFLCVGTIEHVIGSRKIEDMGGLIMRMPKVSVMLQIGIAGMFLAPFGMLISKWAVLRALINYNPMFALVLVFGSAATLFFWVKWIGKLLLIDRPYHKLEAKVSKDQMIALGTLTVLTILICAFFSPVANAMIEPYVFMMYGKQMAMSSGNVTLMGIMLTMVALFPLGFLDSSRKVKITDAYLAGANTGQRSHQFTSSLGAVQDMAMKNYYLEDYFSEKRLMNIGVLVAILFCIVLFVIGGMGCL